ncbi:HAMP domain-containing histidine kinase [Sphingomonas sp. So64.6b]|uniref:sensor histidine kinase n=1 Tax=Sphingomonas sp. So64.6b TaxID=2997354 RepID=UPI0016041823|nr:HAMP domain-containing sensor histidine kinase [Sphingomonas sp. So64.6b]QNA84678.1 HAMP domain-containing histidine kinase [Sphingomonas sp. So64.6b]
MGISMVADRIWAFNRLKLAPRIAFAIFLTICATFLLNQALRAMIPPPPFLVVQRNWLIDAIADGARRAPVLSNPAHDDVPLQVAASRYLDFNVSTKVPDPDTGGGALIGEVLRRSVAQNLHCPVERVRVAMEPYDQNNLERTVRTAVVIIPELPALLTAESLANTKSSVLGDFAISVRLDGGAWMTVTPRNVSGPWRHYARYFIGVTGYLLIIIVFSVWMARSIVVPLSRLAAAAEQLGRNREPTLITGMRLPEYVAISDTFNTMQLRLKRFIDERMAMLAAISHDLRTPLTRLRLMAEYVSDPAQRDQLLLNVSEMETMVSDALAFMGAEARREPIETVDVAALLISLTDDYCDAGERVSYSGPDHADLPCRPVALKRAFSNLIANGCKYGGAVDVVLRVGPATFAVEVHDEGAGIPPDQAARAFEPFERLETSRSRETGGSGLGLAISRDIIRGHGGEIGFDWPDAGFTVWVSLPRPG